ncbi:major capsid protein [Dipodfec virus UOA04_Rod_1017]|nr:major capsid protein [Dipodfec virus UOA04_Rod_1017]
MAKGYRNTLFESVKTPNPPRNKFDLSHDYKSSFKMGKLYPVLCEEMIPGDKFRISSDALVRCMPMSSPVYGNLRMYVHYFFVPNRLLMTKWEDFITQDGTHTKPIQVPYVTYGKLTEFAYSWMGKPSVPENVLRGSLADYLGLPLYKPLSTGAGYQNFSYDAAPVNLLPFKAYAKIWNDYYRDQNLSNEINLSEGATGNQSSWMSSVTPMNRWILDLQNRSWLKDYFTSALPTPQRGPDVLIPIDAINSTVVANGPLTLNTTGTTTEGDDLRVKVPTSGPGGTQYMIEAGMSGQTSTYRSGLSVENEPSITATINDLRRAIALQRFEEISARSGNRYIEQILGHFHVRSSDARLQRAEYIGGGVTPIQIGEVLQTSATDSTSPQGNLAGRGIGFGRSNQCTYFAEEHGYLMGIASIIPEAQYFQGIRRMYNKLDPDDFYWPSFAHLGEQEIHRSELKTMDAAGMNSAEELFGYAPRYAEYKYVPNTITGELRTSMANWTFARELSGAILNESFVNVPNITNPYAVQDDTDKYIVWFSHRISALRPMPFFGTPSIL